MHFCALVFYLHNNKLSKFVAHSHSAPIARAGRSSAAVAASAYAHIYFHFSISSDTWSSLHPPPSTLPLPLDQLVLVSFQFRSLKSLNYFAALVQSALGSRTYAAYTWCKQRVYALCNSYHQRQLAKVIIVIAVTVAVAVVVVFYCVYLCCQVTFYLSNAQKSFVILTRNAGKYFESANSPSTTTSRWPGYAARTHTRTRIYVLYWCHKYSWKIYS